MFLNVFVQLKIQNPTSTLLSKKYEKTETSEHSLEKNN